MHAVRATSSPGRIDGDTVTVRRTMYRNVLRSSYKSHSRAVDTPPGSRFGALKSLAFYGVFLSKSYQAHGKRKRLQVASSIKSQFPVLAGF